MRYLLPLALVFFCAVAHAQPLTPDITSWQLNTTGRTGYNGLPADVQKVQYSDSSVYVSCSDIPSYPIGPWPMNPNTPRNQNFVYKIPRNPKQNTGAFTETALGHIGVWRNGVSIFNAKDAMSYQNGNIWHQNAVVVETPSFDTCLGHPAPNGEYHHHQNPRCIYVPESTKHSPIIGYAFDGYPVYGAYAYFGMDGTGGIVRMRSSYYKRTITQRTTLPDKTALTPAQYGPDVSATYPLGYYVEDYEYIDCSGDLDQHNGRFSVTPEFPNGTYAYFVTTDEEGHSAYPYVIGPTYDGVVQMANIGPNGGHVTVTEPVTDYTGTAGVADNLTSGKITVYPNPASSMLSIHTGALSGSEVSISLMNSLGEEVAAYHFPTSNATLQLPVDGLARGVYLMRLRAGTISVVRNVVLGE